MRVGVLTSGISSASLPLSQYRTRDRNFIQKKSPRTQREKFTALRKTPRVEEQAWTAVLQMTRRVFGLLCVLAILEVGSVAEAQTAILPATDAASATYGFSNLNESESGRLQPSRC
jgi:hypothetical protein